MKLNVHTSIIQILMLNNMFSTLPAEVMSEEEKEKIDTILTALNDMCNERNGFTLTITAE